VLIALFGAGLGLALGTFFRAMITTMANDGIDRLGGSCAQVGTGNGNVPVAAAGTVGQDHGPEDQALDDERLHEITDAREADAVGARAVEPCGTSWRRARWSRRGGTERCLV
jgi:hypothetical protein